MQLPTTKSLLLPGSLPSGLLLAVLVLGPIRIAHAQAVVAPESNATALMARPATDTGQTPAVPFSGLSSTNNQLIWGPATFHPQVSYRYLSSDGVQSLPGQKSRTNIHSLSLGLATEFGLHWDARYLQTWTLYSSKAFRDAVDRQGSVSWNTQYDAWKLNANYEYYLTDTPLVETGAQTKQTVHATTFDALYALGIRYTLETTLLQNLHLTEQYNNPREWSIREMVRQRTLPQLDTGVGVQYSYTAIKKAPDTSSVQLLADLNWRPLEQMAFWLQAGLERRRVYSKPTSDETNPVYSASLQFTPQPTTQLSLSASRAISASFLESQLSETTQYGVTLQQNLLQRFQCMASFTRHDTTYKGTQQELAIQRADKTDSLNLGLNTVMLSKIRVSLAYQYNRNTSSILGFSFKSNQYSIELGYTY